MMSPNAAGRAGGLLLVFPICLAAVLAIGTRPAAGLDAGKEANTVYRATPLVSNVPGRTAYADSSLVDPWGLTSSESGGWWVADEGRGFLTEYSGNGVPMPALSPNVITIPVSPGGVNDNASPTGVAFNNTGGFETESGDSAAILLATRDGTVTGWSGLADEDEASLLVDNSPEAAYSGAATALLSGTVLYVVNFGQGRVEAYGADLSPVPLGDNAFVDPLIPDGFAPYNIQNVKGVLVVTYAAPMEGRMGVAVPEAGAGYVDAFDPEGNLVQRFEHGRWLNAPWGIALAPPGFGDFSERLLVGNTGSGKVASFDFLTGRFLGYLPGGDGVALAIPGLHGLGFGNNAAAGPATTLYFTAGPEGGGKSSFGSISALHVEGHPQAVPPAEVSGTRGN